MMSTLSPELFQWLAANSKMRTGTQKAHRRPRKADRDKDVSASSSVGVKHKMKLGGVSMMEETQALLFQLLMLRAQAETNFHETQVGVDFDKRKHVISVQLDIRVTGKSLDHSSDADHDTDASDNALSKLGPLTTIAPSWSDIYDANDKSGLNGEIAALIEQLNGRLFAPCG